jgi:hypothetical protein
MGEEGAKKTLKGAKNLQGLWGCLGGKMSGDWFYDFG